MAIQFLDLISDTALSLAEVEVYAREVTESTKTDAIVQKVDNEDLIAG